MPAQPGQMPRDDMKILCLSANALQKMRSVGTWIAVFPNADDVIVQMRRHDCRGNSTVNEPYVKLVNV